MRATDLMLVYALFGSACALALIVTAKQKSSALVDAALLVPFWPLYGPFLVLGRGAPAELAPLDRLHQCLALAKSRVADIDRLLVRPELDEGAARARLAELAAAGDERSAGIVQARLTNIDRLRRLRDRFARETTEIDELLAQLQVQAEVVRLSGGADGTTRDLLEDITARADGLEAILAVDLDG